MNRTVDRTAPIDSKSSRNGRRSLNDRWQSRFCRGKLRSQPIYKEHLRFQALFAAGPVRSGSPPPKCDALQEGFLPFECGLGRSDSLRTRKSSRRHRLRARIAPRTISQLRENSGPKIPLWPPFVCYTQTRSDRLHSLCTAGGIPRSFLAGAAIRTFPASRRVAPDAALRNVYSIPPRDHRLLVGSSNRLRSLHSRPDAVRFSARALPTLLLCRAGRSICWFAQPCSRRG